MYVMSIVASVDCSCVAERKMSFSLGRCLHVHLDIIVSVEKSGGAHRDFFFCLSLCLAHVDIHGSRAGGEQKHFLNLIGWCTCTVGAVCYPSRCPNVAAKQTVFSDGDFVYLACLCCLVPVEAVPSSVSRRNVF